MSMTPEEIRAEVERRKQRARDLGIREILWHLEKQLKSYRLWLRDEPQFAARLIYPGIELSDDEARFSIGQSTCQLTYRKGRVSSEDFGGDTFETTRGILTLRVNGESVFECEVSETVQYAHDAPLFSDHVGSIEGFIEGPWVTELPDFMQKVAAQEKLAWKERNAPREAKEAEELRKRFGL